MGIKKAILPLLATGVLISGMMTGSAVFADEDERGERNERYEREERRDRDDRNRRDERGEREEREERGDRGARYLAPATNPAYKQECSSCHFLYLPGLLPARSWEAIMNTTDKHFGENLGIDENTKKEITAYLTANAAEHAKNRRSDSILSSIGSATPTRITEVPYIVREHRKIKPEVFKRPSIGSFSNCGACHTKGAEGNFEEEAVSIPK